MTGDVPSSRDVGRLDILTGEVTSNVGLETGYVRTGEPHRYRGGLVAGEGGRLGNKVWGNT